MGESQMPSKRRSGGPSGACTLPRPDLGSPRIDGIVASRCNVGHPGEPNIGRKSYLRAWNGATSGWLLSQPVANDLL